MSNLIGDLEIPTPDTRLHIVSDKCSSHKGQMYGIRLGGKWDWDSILLANISKSWNAGQSFIGGGITSTRTDLWMVASKAKTSIKTLQDFTDKTGVHFAHNDDGVLFVGSHSWMKPHDKVRDTYWSSTSTDNLTMIC